MPPSVCRHCGAEILWIYVHPSGARMPLEHEAIPVPNVRLVAFNHSTGKGKVLNTADVTPDRMGVMPAERWAEKARVTFHRTHFTNKRCKKAQKDAEKAREEQAA